MQWRITESFMKKVISESGSEGYIGINQIKEKHVPLFLPPSTSDIYAMRFSLIFQFS